MDEAWASHDDFFNVLRAAPLFGCLAASSKVFFLHDVVEACAEWRAAPALGQHVTAESQGWHELSVGSVPCSHASVAPCKVSSAPPLMWTLKKRPSLLLPRRQPETQTSVAAKALSIFASRCFVVLQCTHSRQRAHCMPEAPTELLHFTADVGSVERRRASQIPHSRTPGPNYFLKSFKGQGNVWWLPRVQRGHRCLEWQAHGQV